MPPTNPARRRALTDSAIDLLAVSGAHGLTHRAVEKHAGLPPGTASNYFRSREALLLAAAERIAELHAADTERDTWRHEIAAAGPARTTADVLGQFADLLTGSLLEAATTLRSRYLAVCELRLEAVRRPALSSALAEMEGAMAAFTTGQHTDLDLPFPRDRIPLLIALYSGALFTLVTAPPDSITRDAVHGVARAIVTGALAEG
ncbi:TetR family transcriptional regulator [Murinocardiopsis flavida]|uniref:TetR family transcriptional regulator n=1 Tax=Murinocardiopsis flavida TaxID=645275 RepID=A0A2P8CF32_9ACTN|nr:TetR/AcrR family transcriptional regulator [Murinocardiopsis flavida]PSK83584.1 TetR family transcriptional regulator [Murinocardiopsis flavida]